MNIEIHNPELERLLTQRLEAGGFDSVEELLLDTLRRDQAEPAAQEASKKEAQPDESIGEMIRRIVGDPPPEELAKLPKDAASQLDHYLYGAPKR